MSGDLVGLEMEDAGGHVIARLTGELDIAGAQDTGERIVDAVPTTARVLIVEMTGLEFIDSSGVAMLFGLVRHLGARRQDLLVVAQEGGPVARVLEIVEFARAAPVHPDLGSALAALR